MGITHLDEAVAVERGGGHISGRWTLLGESAGSVTVGVRRIQCADGHWTTPVHDHGGGEEIFYVLGGRGVLLHDGRGAEIGEGDCFVCHAGAGAHSMLGADGLDVLAFGPRHVDLSTRFPRLGLSMIGARFVESVAPEPGTLLQFAREIELGAPALPQIGPRPATMVNLADVEPVTVVRPRIARTRRNLGVAVGSIQTGLQHVEVHPRKLSAPAHCHSLEEELFVVLAGDGTLHVGEEAVAVREGHVVSRPAGTGVAHHFEAGEHGLRILAYGTRERGDIVHYPHSGKVLLRGVGVWLRAQQLDYWDGED
jgi:uncharacterized cupin superfamily protein